MSKNNKIPTNPFNKQYSSLIQSIKIFLPSRNKKKDAGDYSDFVGRERLMERLYNWLSDDEVKSGSYLVTGFRGMGKTSLVERVTNRLTREINQKQERRLFVAFKVLPFVVFALFCFFITFEFDKAEFIPGLTGYLPVLSVLLLIVSFFIILALVFRVLHRNKFKREQRKARENVPNHDLFENEHVDKMARGKRDDYSKKEHKNIKISINLGHEVLRERDVLSLIATNVKDKYKDFVKSIQPHVVQTVVFVVVVCLMSALTVCAVEHAVEVKGLKKYSDPKEIYVHSVSTDTTNAAVDPTVKIIGNPNESWFSRLSYNVGYFVYKAYQKPLYRHVLVFLFYALVVALYGWLLEKLIRLVPKVSTPGRALRRLDVLADRIVSTTDEESGIASSVDKSVFSISLFSRRKHKSKPIADIREIETELADIINQIKSKSCPSSYRVNFIVVFDEMDKIDPMMMEQPKGNVMPEFTDSVKGFPDGMDSRERRRNVLKLLANIKLFVSTAQAKFVFISGRELYDAYLADLSDRDFAISSIFSGVINVDSFLTPEGGQTDVRSMSEWYIANRLLPDSWLKKQEYKNAEGYRKNDGNVVDDRVADYSVLKQERPSLRWYYEYLVEECKNNPQDAVYVIGFLHTFAAYLTHISNGSPKKIFLYFDKYIRLAKDCKSINDWGDVCSVGMEEENDKEQIVLFFEPMQQKTINFIYYLSNPIMGTITNDMSAYGDRFLVSLSFIIDHIYKYHNRSFSWRNLEQIPDLLKTSKAPELRDEMTSIMEFLTQVHISPILIGLDEYKFHKSIDEEISVMSRISDEASAIFNFTLDESLSVIQYNTRLLNYYKELDREGVNEGKDHQYLPLIARIHSNLGDLHYWDEDYYAATLEYRASIETLPDTDQDDESGFLTRVRCMLKLGLTYELRKLYPNAYQTYCRLIYLLIEKRWVNEKTFGLNILAARTGGWQEKRQIMARLSSGETTGDNAVFNSQFGHRLFDGDYNVFDEAIPYSVNFDGVVSSFASDLTPEKTKTINTLTLFEEMRYLYQSILAKLSILEKMGMSGITQTNIDVAEGEFRTIHKSVNFREKFIIAADFFRKLAEILYYKNSLTILTQNQDSIYVSYYYYDLDLLSNLDDFCLQEKGGNAITIKHDVRYFFYKLNNSVVSQGPMFRYDGEGSRCTLLELFGVLRDKVETLIDSDCALQASERSQDKKRITENVKKYLTYNIEKVAPNSKIRVFFRSVEACDHHSNLLRKRGLRTPCYACKYYTRSLRILVDNMFIEKDILDNIMTKSIGFLKYSFKNKLLYTNSANIRALAQTLEGFGNVLYSCASGDIDEGEVFRSKRGVSAMVLKMLRELSQKFSEKEEEKVVLEYEAKLSKCMPLSRIDKCILYYWDAYRFYMMDGCYNESVECLNKILNVLVYYIEVLCYYNDGSKLLWNDETEAVAVLIGDVEFNNSFLETVFQLISRYTSYKYDLASLNEINELKWIYSKEIRDDIDLSRLSLYPSIRSAWLRAMEIRAKGLRFLARQHYEGFTQDVYSEFIRLTYPLIAPQRRYETTFYEEVLGYYTKMRYNDHVMNNLLGGNPMVDRGNSDYNGSYHVAFYKSLYEYLNSPSDKNRLDQTLFGIGDDLTQRLKLIDFLIVDTLVCITNMVNVFTPHNHLTSYSKSFVGIVYNFFWEWSRKFEFVHGLYQYQELRKKGFGDDAEKIIDNIWLSGNSQISREKNDVHDQLGKIVRACSNLIDQKAEETVDECKYGSRSDRLYEMLRHDIDDITINSIFSNYTAEMALKYYQMAEESNTEGESYREMIGAMHFLNDDMNNDTIQFNIACDRFLLNCGVVAEQRRRLEKLYNSSGVYNITRAYITGPTKANEESVKSNQFDRSQFINSEY